MSKSFPRLLSSILICGILLLGLVTGVQPANAQNRHYALLYDSNTKTITFPVKAPRNVFGDYLQFAGGYPAIFGGNEQRNPQETIRNEVYEESRKTIEASGQATLFYRPQNDTRYHFYSTTEWFKNGTPWQPPNSNEEGEMLKIVTVPIADLQGYPDFNRFLDRLISVSGAPGGSTQQQNEFRQSYTAQAFYNYVN